MKPINEMDILTLINVILMSINLCIYYKEYLENKRKNTMEIMPVLDVDIYNVTISILQDGKINFMIPFYSFKGIVTKIELYQNNALIGTSNTIINQNNWIYFNIEQNLTFGENQMNLKMVLFDFDETKYEQEIKLSFEIYNFEKAIGFLAYYKIVNINNTLVHIYYVNKEIKRPVKIKN